jgi:glycine hydroxymethyltransferase
VAVLAASAVDILAYGRPYMEQIVRNAQALGDALHRRGIPMLGSHKGYTRTHQVIADVRQFGAGLAAAERLARANIITNKNLIPSDKPSHWDHPGGLRMGTTEVTRLGMREAEMEQIGDFIARVLVDRVEPGSLQEAVTSLRQPFQTVYYCVENGLPPPPPES